MFAAIVVVYDLLHLAWFFVAALIYIIVLHMRLSLVLIRLVESCQKVRLEKISPCRFSWKSP